MSGDYAGEFEVMVLLAIMRLGDDAYGWTVAEELERVAGRTVTSGALYTTINRLERKGMLESRSGGATEARGGRPRRYLSVTPDGAEAVLKARRALERLWSGVDIRPAEAG